MELVYRVLNRGTLLWILWLKPQLLFMRYNFNVLTEEGEKIIVTIDKEELSLLIEELLEKLPPLFKNNISNVEFVVEDYPNSEIQRRFGSRFLLGLYQGIPLPRRSGNYNLVMPDRIVIYRENLERIAGKNWPEELEKVLWHEIGHYFGLSDKELWKLSNQKEK